jgi:hypothetical protein
VVWGLSGPAGAHAQAPDPRLRWHTLRTEHFEITFHEPLAPLAQRLANAAERATSSLTAALGYRASQRTLILLTDETDDANGSAGVIPRNEIRLFASAPDDLSTIGDYDDWISTLVTHEHTHILHLDQIGGLPALVNAILGKTAAPNAVQPRWFIEGLAVFEESARTSAGRERSSIVDMVLRMDALSGRLMTLAQISNDPVRWPHGDIPYVYGSRFIGFIAERYGAEALSRIGRDYGRQAIPFGLNRIAKRATGFTFVELYEQFRQALTAHYAEQRARIEAVGVVEGSELARHADLTRSPRYLRDGRLAYYAQDGRSSGRIRTPDGTLLTRTAGEAALSPHPDGKSIIYSQYAPYRDIYSLHDLFRLDLDSGDSERLSHGLRASQPDVSPGGRDVVFVTQANGSSQLEEGRLDDVDATHHVVFRSRPFEQVFTPRYSPDGKQIAWSAWRTGGYRDILLLDRDSGSVRELTHDRAQDSGPTWSPDGARVYFSSDRSGVANVYAYELGTGLTYQITNVVGGAYQPAVSPDGKTLAYVSYTDLGFGLRTLALARVPVRLAEPFADTRPTPAAPPVDQALPVHPYNPLPTLPPHNYQLEVRDGALGTELSVSVGGADIAGFHHYALQTAVSIDSGDPSVSLSYSYGRSPLYPSLRIFRELSARYDLGIAGKPRRWIEDGIGGSVALSYAFPSVLKSQNLDFDYTLTHVGKARPFGGAIDPNDPPPTLPELGFMPSAGLGYRYSDVTREAYDVSPSGGRNLALRVGVTDPIMGRDLHTVSVRWALRQFIAMPWAALHVLAIRYAGGESGGDPGRAGVFSIGGFPQNSPFISLYDFAVFGAIPNISGDALRGYPQGFRSGTQFHQLQVEYRFPLFAPELGVYTLPAYLRRLYADVFTDVGDATSGRLELSHFLVGSGAELFTQIEITYRVIVTIRLGIAHGFGDGGLTQYYFHLGTPF